MSGLLWTHASASDIGSTVEVLSIRYSSLVPDNWKPLHELNFSRSEAAGTALQKDTDSSHNHAFVSSCRDAQRVSNAASDVPDQAVALAESRAVAYDEFDQTVDALQTVGKPSRTFGLDDASESPLLAIPYCIKVYRIRCLLTVFEHGDSKM